MNRFKSAGGHMKETFTINVYYDEMGEKIENLMSHLIINKLEEDNEKLLTLRYFNS